MKVGAKTTVVVLLRPGEVMLAMKKVRFGAGKWNGLGGKIDEGETPRTAAVREAYEESGVRINSTELEKVGFIRFFSPVFGNTETHIYRASSWEGEPKETEEMRPQWFSVQEIPYRDMWTSDRHWLPYVVDGECFMGEFHYDINNKVVDWKITPTSSDELEKTDHPN